MIRAIDKEGLKRLGKLIKRHRRDRDISQEALAFDANVSLSQLSRIESGKHNTSFSTILAIARALNISLNGFFNDFNYPPVTKAKRKK